MLKISNKMAIIFKTEFLLNSLKNPVKMLNISNLHFHEIFKKSKILQKTVVILILDLNHSCSCTYNFRFEKKISENAEFCKKCIISNLCYHGIFETSNILHKP